MIVKGINTPSGGVQSPQFFCIQSTGNDVPAPWPFRHPIKARFLDGVPTKVREILKLTLEEWLNFQSAREITVLWVDTGESDVRFDLNGSGITTCSLGKALPASGRVQRCTVSLGLRAWKEGESEIVWTHSEMERMARHVWGHVFGLPHALNETSFQWNNDALKDMCCATNINTSQITELWGNSRLDAKDSVMHYDRPSEMVTLPFSFPDRVGSINEQEIQLLNELYPPPREFEVVDQWCSQMPGWKETSTEKKLLTREHSLKWTGGENIYALNYVDIATNGDYMACAYLSYPGDPKVLTFAMGASAATTHIIDLRASYLLWNAPDFGIQSGFDYTGKIRGFSRANAQGERFEKRIDFSKPFRSTPNVMTFIYHFWVEKGNWIRMKVFTKDISTTGFTMCLHSWANTFCHNIGAHWVAHEVDDPTIRSGRWEPPEHPLPSWATEDHATLTYDSPLAAKPRQVFCGFNHVNVQGGVNARFRCDALSSTASSVDMKISTWEAESAYHQMGASYIALL